MIKINFNNQLKDEDRQLIHLLKEPFLESPSDQLVENTMARFSALQAEKQSAHKPLRIPVYIMIAIVLLLLLPFFVPMVSNNAYLTLLPELLIYPVSSILKYAILCWLAVVVLQIFKLILPIQLKFDLKPFKP
jgi:hypothetical protein